MVIELRNPWLWVLAVIAALAIVYFVGPLTGAVFPLEFFYKGGGNEIYISGWTELLIFVVVIRVLLGTAAAQKLLEDLV